MGLRSTREQHLVQQARDYSTNYVRNAHLVKSSRVIGEICAEKAAIMNSNAIESVDTRWFHVYKKMTFGRVCSCTSEESSSPTQGCPVCFNTGFVGGFEKYGTWQEVIDHTREVDLINVEPAYDLNMQPTLLRLTEKALVGEIIATVNLRANAGYTDALDYIDSVSDPANSSVTLYARESGTLKWYPFDIENTSNLDPMLGASAIDIKIVLRRRDISTPTPYFSNLIWRYGLLPKTLLLVPADIPKASEGVSLLDYGWDENFAALTLTMDRRIQALKNGDLFYYVNRSRWLTVTSVTPWQAVDTFMGIECDARFMQTYEPGARVIP